MKQMEQFLIFVKNTVLNNKPIGHYIKHIKLEDKYIFKDGQFVTLLKLCPNIQSLITFDKTSISFLLKPPIPFRPPLSFHPPPSSLQQLTHFSLWYTDLYKGWVYTLESMNHDHSKRRTIKTLEFEIDTGRMLYSGTGEPPSPIQLKPIDTPRIVTTPIDINSQPKIYKSFILALPLFKRLKYLNIHSGYRSYSVGRDIRVFDEHTLENISQSCPFLETLSLEYFNMYASKEMDTILLDSMFKQDHQLKELNISGELMDPKCFTYLSKKYPRLESLQLCLSPTVILKENIVHYKSIINDMMTQFTCLKKLEIYLHDRDYYHRVNEIVFAEHGMNAKYWLNNGFLEWLLQHPTQITHLTYHNSLLDVFHSIARRLIANIPEQPNLDIYYDGIINKIKLQDTLFLHHLTYLSLSSNFSRKILYNYLLQNEHTTILSSSIRELEINKSYYQKYSIFYISDWLDAFPNLTLLTVTRCKVINDKDDIHHWDLINDIDNDSNSIHELIKQRKQRKLDSSNNNINNCHSVYQLKNLVFDDCEISMKNGFNDLFKRCHQLKKLKLHYIKYALLKWSEELDTNFDLAHLSLEELRINSLRYIPYNFKLTSTDPILATKLIIKETIPDTVSIIPIDFITYSRYATIPSSSTLHLECKCVADKILFKEPSIY
ncbi:unnamed protein product [Cunninghamella echinulata]